MDSTDSYFSTAGEAFEFAMRALSDTWPTDKKVDLVYLFAQTDDNASPVFDTAEALFKASQASLFGMSAAPSGHGYGGGESWKRHLLARGLPETAIVLIDLPAGLGINTLSEAIGIVDFCASRSWRTVVAVSPPFHQPRSFLTLVSATMRRPPHLHVHAYRTKAQAWSETVVHSQGVLVATRRQLISEELGRMGRYHGQGDLVSSADLFRYLDWRDTSCGASLL